MLNVKTCPCGQKIVFVQDAENPETTHPLDISSPTYAVSLVNDLGYASEHNGGGGAELEELRAVKQNLKLPETVASDPAILVSHFRTCTRVREFAASRKKIEASDD